MKKRIFLIALALLVAGALASRLLTRDKPVGRHESKDTKDTFEQVLSAIESSIIPESEPALSGMPERTIVIDMGSENGDVDNGGIYTFQVDEHGHLVLDEKSRLAIERLHALNTPEELKEKLQKFSSALPSKAQYEIVNLIDCFEKYSNNIKQISPEDKIDKAPETVEGAFALLQEVHDLRVMYFGADAAEALFGKEETKNRQLLELMYKEKDNKM